MENERNYMQVFGLGNPLLDMTATVDDEFLQRYELPKDSAIIAGDLHEQMYADLMANYEVELSAGGSAQTTLRYCQWIIGKDRPVTTYFGAVGGDNYGELMEKYAEEDGVQVRYQVEDECGTGVCAVLVTDGGNARSLCAYLGASETFGAQFLLDNFRFVERAGVIYTTGHMLSVSAESVIHLARYAHETGKYFFFNLAAPYVSENCSQELSKILLYVDFFFANSDEALSLAEAHNYDTNDVKEVAKIIAKKRKFKPFVDSDEETVGRADRADRVVIVTQGSKPVLLARSDSDDVLEFPVRSERDEPRIRFIRDTNGAGDAFAGGFLAMFIQHKPIEECIRCALYCATECIQQLGCNLPDDMEFE